MVKFLQFLQLGHFHQFFSNFGQHFQFFDSLGHSFRKIVMPIPQYEIRLKELTSIFFLYKESNQLRPKELISIFFLYKEPNQIRLERDDHQTIHMEKES